MATFYMTKRFLSYFLALATLGLSSLALPSIAWAGGVFLSELGTPDSLGTAGVGNVTNDRNASAIAMNPAGLSAIEDKEWLVGAQVGYLDAEFKADQPASDKQDGGGWLGMPAIFYAHRVTPDIVLAASLNAEAGAGMDFGSSWEGRYFLNEIEMSFLRITGGVSYQVNEDLSLGFGVIGEYGLLEVTKSLRRVAPGDGELKMDELDDIAPGFSLGLMYQIADPIRLGLSYSSKIEHDLDGDLDINGIGASLPLPPVPVLGGSSGLELSMDTPATYSAGLNFDVSDELELMLHLSYQKWKDFGKLEAKFDGGLRAAGDLKLNNTYDYGIAASYQFPEWKGYVGFNYATQVVDNADRLIILPGDSVYKLGVGAEIPFGNRKVLGLGYTISDLGTGKLNQQAPLPPNETLSGHFDSYYLHIFAISLKF
jgi:long-chain fatty acid transport protein